MNRNVVSFHFVLRDASGRVLDMSQGGEPVRYLEGADQIIDGLEEALRGASPGQELKVQLPAGKAYGQHDPSLVQVVARGSIPVEGDLNVGDRFQTEPDPYAPVVTIAAVDGDQVTLDGNHPLAGVDLTFDVQVLAVRAATEAELSQNAPNHDGCCGGGGGGNCGCGCGSH